VLDRVVFTDFAWYAHGQLPFGECGIGEVAARPLPAQCCTKLYIKMADVPVLGFRKYWTQKLASLQSECHAITNIRKYPEAASVVQQIYRVLSDTEILAGCTPAKVEESCEWTSIVKSAEENRANFY
jgi:hypothetical protein